MSDCKKNDIGEECKIYYSRNVYRYYRNTDITEKPPKKRPFWRSRKRKEDIIKTDLEKRRCEGVERIHLAYDRKKLRALVNAILDIQFTHQQTHLFILKNTLKFTLKYT